MTSIKCNDIKLMHFSFGILICREMIDALSQFGLSTSEDMDMVAQIKSEVRKLCTRNIIASQIIVNETDEARREHLARMVCQTEEDIEVRNVRKIGLGCVWVCVWPVFQ